MGDTEEFAFVATEGAVAGAGGNARLGARHAGAITRTCRALLDGKVARLDRTPPRPPSASTLAAARLRRSSPTARSAGSSASPSRPGNSFDVDRWQELAQGFASVAATAIARGEARRRASRPAGAPRLFGRRADRPVARARSRSCEARARRRPTFSPTSATSCGRHSRQSSGFSEMLLRGDDGPLNPRQHEDIDDRPVERPAASRPDRRPHRHLADRGQSAGARHATARSRAAAVRASSTSCARWRGQRASG